MNIQLHVEGGIIRQARIYSDALETEVFPKLEELLQGAIYKKKALSGLNLEVFKDMKEYIIAVKVIEQITGQME